MHVVIAPDKFKGSLTAGQVADAVADGVARVRPELELHRLPVADGGEGTLDAVLAAGFHRHPVTVAGPTGEPVRSAFGLRDRTAVIELADACGLDRLPGGHRAPLRASSHGIGELIAAALAIGARTVVLGVGGSASTDGGAGMLAALGARILDREGRPVAAGGAALAAADSLDLSGLNPAVRHARFVLASDVDNPLLGPHGAATVYGPQKGADCHQVLALEDSLSRWSALVAATTGADRSRTSGAGAAGGVGFGALAVLDARRRSGIAAVLALVGMSRQLRNALLVITGEGSLDAQSLRGKAPIGVAQAADAAGVPSVGVAGRCSLGDAELAQTHLRAVYTLSALQPDAAKSIIQAPALLRDLGARIATDWLGDPIAVHPERMGCRSPEG